jgi:hypothetical protein
VRRILSKTTLSDAVGSIEFILGMVTSFLYSAIVSLAVKICREEKMKYSLIIAGTHLMLITALSNEIGMSLNPLFYLPMMIVEFYFKLEFFLLGLVIPVVFGFLGFYTAHHAIKHIAGDIDNSTEPGVIELQMIKAKQIVFEV